MRVSRCQSDGPAWDLHGRSTERAAPGLAEVWGWDTPVLTPITEGGRGPKGLGNEEAPTLLEKQQPSPVLPPLLSWCLLWGLSHPGKEPLPSSSGSQLAPRRPSAGGEDRLPARGVGGAVLGAAAEEKEKWAERRGVQVPGSCPSDTLWLWVCISPCPIPPKWHWAPMLQRDVLSLRSSGAMLGASREKAWLLGSWPIAPSGLPALPLT